MRFLDGVAARRGYFFVSATIFVLDQMTKVLAHSRLRGRDSVAIIPGVFDLSYARNPGGLFGYFGDLGDPWRTLLLTLMPILAIGLVAAFLARGQGTDRPTLFGLALILGGAVGNLVDRLLRGEVVDFFDVYASAPRLAQWLSDRFGTAHWPTFNVADSAIVVGACFLVLSIIRPQKPAANQHEPR